MAQQNLKTLQRSLQRALPHKMSRGLSRGAEGLVARALRRIEVGLALRRPTAERAEASIGSNPSVDVRGTDRSGWRSSVKQNLGGDVEVTEVLGEFFVDVQGGVALGRLWPPVCPVGGHLAAGRLISDHRCQVVT